MQNEVSAAIDECFAECVRVIPVEPGPANFPGTPQPDTAVSATAVFLSPAMSIRMNTDRGREYGRSVPIISTSKPTFSFSYGALPWTLYQGYQIMLPRTGEIFEVTDVQPDGVSRIVAQVTQVGRQSEER